MLEMLFRNSLESSVRLVRRCREAVTRRSGESRKMFEVESLGTKVSLQNDWRVKVNWVAHKTHVRRKAIPGKSAINMELHLNMETLHFSTLQVNQVNTNDIIIGYPDVSKVSLMFDENDNFCLVIAFHSGRPYCIVYDSSKMELYKLQQNIKFANDVCVARQSLRGKTRGENFLPTLYEIGDVLRHWMDNSIERDSMLLVATDLVSQWVKMHKRFNCEWDTPTIEMIAILLDEIRVPSLELYDFLATCMYDWAGEEELKIFLEDFLLKLLRHPLDIKYVPELSSLISYYMYVMTNQSQGFDYHFSFVNAALRNREDKISAENLATVCSKGITCLYHNMTLSTPKEVAIPRSVLETSTRLKVELETISGLNLFSSDPTAPIITMHDNDDELYFEKTEENRKFWNDLSQQIGHFRFTDVLSEHCRDMPHGKRRYDFITAMYFHTWDHLLTFTEADFKMVISRMLCAFPYYERALEEHVFASCLVKLNVKHDLCIPFYAPLGRILQTTVNKMTETSS